MEITNQVIIPRASLTQIGLWALRLKNGNKDFVMDVVDGQVVKKPITPLTQDQINIVNQEDVPASHDFIMNELKKLSLRKRITGSKEQILYIIRDTANRLEGVKRWQIRNAIEWFIEKDKSEWFPQFALIKKKCELK